MLLEEWAPGIQPDIVVLQLCANDFINNSLELEGRELLRTTTAWSVRTTLRTTV